MQNFVNSIKADYHIADNGVKLMINGVVALELPLEYSKDIEDLANLLNVEGIVYL